MRDEKRISFLNERDRIALLLSRLQVDRVLYFACEETLNGEMEFSRGIDSLSLLIYANGCFEAHLQELCDAWERVEELYRAIMKKE